ncbi:hypothetical protein niasHT_018591 [Heterodera trifolii]|uniref:Uncharacterized protein n=1 Tax=Heterodera trifolii TaxID=157864 RepID=A0ABD2LBH8_9BILA
MASVCVYYNWRKLARIIYGQEFNGGGYAINGQFGEGNWQTQRLGGQHDQFRSGNWQNGQNRAQSGRSEVNTLSQGGGANHRQAASNSCDQILKNSSSAIEQLIKGRLINPIEDNSQRYTLYAADIARTNKSGCFPQLIADSAVCSQALCYHLAYRSIDGVCNNLARPTLGASFRAYMRLINPLTHALPVPRWSANGSCRQSFICAARLGLGWAKLRRDWFPLLFTALVPYCSAFSARYAVKGIAPFLLFASMGLMLLIDPISAKGGREWEGGGVTNWTGLEKGLSDPFDSTNTGFDSRLLRRTLRLVGVRFDRCALLRLVGVALTNGTVLSSDDLAPLGSSFLHCPAWT